MHKFIKALCIITANLMAGCGGTQTVTRMNSASPETIRAVAISPQAGNSPEVDSYIAGAFISRGVGVSPPLPLGTLKSNSVDAIVTYTDVWRWDLTMYLDSISVYLYNAKTGELLVTGRWRDSFFHAYNRGEGVAKSLIAEMLSKLDGESQNKSQIR